MEHQLKSLKIIKRLFNIVVLSSIVISCANAKSYATLYFFEQKDMSTIVSLSCDNVVDHQGLRKIELTDKKLHKFLMLSKKKVILIENYDVDVRYKIQMGSDIFCIDYSGNFILNDTYRGKMNFIDEIETFIEDNKDQSISITDPVPKPWESY